MDCETIYLEVVFIKPGRWDVIPMPGILFHCNVVSFDPNLAVMELLT